MIIFVSMLKSEGTKGRYLCMSMSTKSNPQVKAHILQMNMICSRHRYLQYS